MICLAYASSIVALYQQHIYNGVCGRRRRFGDRADALGAHRCRLAAYDAARTARLRHAQAATTSTLAQAQPKDTGSRSYSSAGRTQERSTTSDISIYM